MLLHGKREEPQQRYEAIEDLLHATDRPPDFGKKHDKLIFRAQLFYFMG